MSVGAKANNNRQQQATSKASYAGPTATEEARAAAKKVGNVGAGALRSSYGGQRDAFGRGV